MQVVVVGALVSDGRVLLAHRSRHRAAYPGRWDLPGGHVEPGEPELDALMRELREELGVEISATSAVPQGRWEAGVAPDRVMLSVWLVRDWTGTPANAAPEEHDEITWFRPEELPPLAHERMRPLLLAAIAARP